MWRWKVKHYWNFSWRQKVDIKKNVCLIHTISLLVICLLLFAVVSVGYYYYYYTSYCKNQNDLLIFDDGIIKLRKIRHWKYIIKI